jgi:hypothetical protein
VKISITWVYFGNDYVFLELYKVFIKFGLPYIIFKLNAFFLPKFKIDPYLFSKMASNNIIIYTQTLQPSLFKLLRNHNESRL